MKNFGERLATYFDEFQSIVSTDSKDWSVKGFIDVHQNIYTISVDTKVVSKIVELMIFPVIVHFARENDLDMHLSAHQNHYPDVSFVSKTTGKKYALDLKSTYRVNKDRINGMTLGAFTGYFRNRQSTKNTTFAYDEYEAHYILGVIYSKTDLDRAEQVLAKKGINVLTEKQRELLSEYLSVSDDESLTLLLKAAGVPDADITAHFDDFRTLLDACKVDERKRYRLDDLDTIFSVVRDFDFFIQEKWKIALDRPGSGNTKNIGSTTTINDLKNGKGIFTRFENGKAVFDDYWMNYLTKDMAQAIGYDKPHYTNLTSYLTHKKID